MLPTMALGLPHQQKQTRGQTRYSGKALLGLLLHWGEQEQATGSLACSHARVGGEFVPYMG